jgi:hypothetical protein
LGATLPAGLRHRWPFTLRLTPTPLHSNADIGALVEALIEMSEGARQREAA